jgi:hypothetical protein
MRMLKDCQTTALQRWRILTTNQKKEDDPLQKLINLKGPPVVLNPIGPRNLPNPLGQPGGLPNPLGQQNLLLNALGQPAGLLMALPKPDANKELLLKQIEYLRLSATILKEMDKYDRATLNEKMRDGNATTRWLAIQSVLMRRLHCEEELLNRLKDPMLYNRSAARDALVRLTRGADFGPSLPAVATPVMTARAQEEAIAGWRQWLKYQDETPAGVNGR